MNVIKDRVRSQEGGWSTDETLTGRQQKVKVMIITVYHHVGVELSVAKSV